MWVRHLYFSSHYICADLGALFPQEVLMLCTGRKPLCDSITPVRQIGAISRLQTHGFGQLDSLLLVVWFVFQACSSLKSRNNKSRECPTCELTCVKYPSTVLPAGRWHRKGDGGRMLEQQQCQCALHLLVILE